MGKPFNPLLGETYQLEQDDFRIFCEQVDMLKLEDKESKPDDCAWWIHSAFFLYEPSFPEEGEMEVTPAPWKLSWPQPYRELFWISEEETQGAAV